MGLKNSGGWTTILIPFKVAIIHVIDLLTKNGAQNV